MREIKFKIWDTNNEVWLKQESLNIRCDGYGTAVQSNTSSGCIGGVEKCQFTGLKDKNGKEIYEGDIINFHQFIQVLGSRMGVSEGEQELMGVIEIDELGVFFNCNSNDDQLSGHLMFFNLHDESLEIIGNIYENPELITK